MPASPPDPSDRSASTGASRHARLKSTLPFVVTALAAIVLSLLIQAALLARQQSVLLLPLTPTSAPATLAPLPTLTPTSILPTPPLPDERILSQEILDLRAELRRVWSAYYLMRAAAQLADAEDALQVNELTEVERILVTVRVSLDQAYALSTEQDKGPIGEFRMQISEVREDLQVRPEGMAQRLQRLRQDMLSLVEEDP